MLTNKSLELNVSKSRMVSLLMSQKKRIINDEGKREDESESECTVMSSAVSSIKKERKAESLDRFLLIWLKRFEAIDVKLIQASEEGKTDHSLTQTYFYSFRFRVLIKGFSFTLWQRK